MHNNTTSRPGAQGLPKAGSSASLPELHKKSVLSKASLRSFWSKLFLCNLAGPRGAVCPLLVRPVFAPRVLACVVLGPSGVGARRRVAVAGAGRRSGGSCAAPFAPSGPSGWSPGAVAVPVAAPLRSAACGLRSLRSLRPPKEDERDREGAEQCQYTAVLRRILAAILRSRRISAIAYTIVTDASPWLSARRTLSM